MSSLSAMVNVRTKSLPLPPLLRAGAVAAALGAVLIRRGRTRRLYVSPSSSTGMMTGCLARRTFSCSAVTTWTSIGPAASSAASSLASLYFTPFAGGAPTTAGQSWMSFGKSRPSLDSYHKRCTTACPAGLSTAVRDRSYSVQPVRPRDRKRQGRLSCWPGRTGHRP